MRHGSRLLVVVLSLVCAGAWAAAPPLLPLQGVLTDVDGVPVTTAVSVRFSLHPAQSSGTELWNETQSVTPQEGLFVAYLGSITALDLGTFRDHGSLWLEVKVGADAAMPRVQLGSTAFAGFAQYCGAHTHASGDLPEGVVVGAQSCGGGQSVRGVSGAGQLVCAPDTLGGLACGAQQIPKWNGTAWACASDETNAGATGDITEVLAGDGLAGGASTGSATLAVMGCAPGQILMRGASAWACSGDYRSATWVPAWSDVSGKPTFAAVATSGSYADLLNRPDLTGMVKGPQACVAGTKASSIDSGGAVLCTADADTLAGLPCADGAIVKRLSGAWDCGADSNAGGDVTDVLATTAGGLQVTDSVGPQPSLGLIDCQATGEVLKYALGTGWDCAADLTLTEAEVDAMVANNGYATQTWVGAQGYATQTWVGAQGYATQTWVGAQGYATQAWVTANDHDTLGGLTCADGMVARRVSGAWACSTDGDLTDVIAGAGIAVSNSGGPQPTVSLAPCPANQVLKSTSPGVWGCADDAVTSNPGDVTDVLAGTGIAVSSSGGPQPTVSLDTTYADARYLLRVGDEQTFTGDLINTSGGNFRNPGCGGWGCISSHVFTSNNYFGADSTATMYLGESNPVIVRGDVRAPIFYDQNNTAFYLDPAGTSMLNDVRASIVYDRDNTAFYVDPAATSILNDVRGDRFYSRQNTSYYLDPDGISQLSDVRADIFYDRNDTNYYVNPASISRVNDLRANYLSANYLYDMSDATYYLHPGGYSNLIRLTIGNALQGHLLAVGTSGAYSDGGAWVDGSSRAVKANIRALELDDARRAVAELRPMRYNYIATPEEESVGFIAEDVPDLVATRDRKGIAALDVVAVLTRVVQDQEETVRAHERRLAGLDAQVAPLAADNQRLRGEVDDLKRRLDRLEQQARPRGRPAADLGWGGLGLGALVLGGVVVARRRRAS